MAWRRVLESMARISLLLVGLIMFGFCTAEEDPGAALYFPCGSCHFSDGSGSEALDAPAIAGLDADYVIRQMKNFKTGLRGSSLEDLTGRQMSLIAASYSDSDIELVASYVAGLQPAAVSRVQPSKVFQPCVVCHGSEGEGKPALGTADLRRLQPWYLARQLRYFRDGLRGGEADTFGQPMRAIVQGLSDEQVMALSQYAVTRKE